MSVYKSFFCISYLCLRLFIENRPTVLFRPIIQIVRLYYFVQSSKSSDCIISSNHPNRPTLLFRPIIQIVRPYYFVRLYYFLRSSNLPFNVQFSSFYFALFLYLNTNLIQIKSRTRTFPETTTPSLRPRRTYCKKANTFSWRHCRLRCYKFDRS